MRLKMRSQYLLIGSSDPDSGEHLPTAAALFLLRMNPKSSVVHNMRKAGAAVEPGSLNRAERVLDWMSSQASEHLLPERSASSPLNNKLFLESVGGRGLPVVLHFQFTRACENLAGGRAGRECQLTHFVHVIRSLRCTCRSPVYVALRRSSDRSPSLASD